MLSNLKVLKSDQVVVFDKSPKFLNVEKCDNVVTFDKVDKALKLDHVVEFGSS